MQLEIKVKFMGLIPIRRMAIFSHWFFGESPVWRIVHSVKLGFTGFRSSLKKHASLLAVNWFLLNPLSAIANVLHNVLLESCCQQFAAIVVHLMVTWKFRHSVQPDGQSRIAIRIDWHQPLDRVDRRHTRNVGHCRMTADQEVAGQIGFGEVVGDVCKS